MPKEDLGVSENLEQQSLTYTLSTSLGPWLVPCPPGRSLRGCWAEGLKVVRLFAPRLQRLAVWPASVGARESFGSVTTGTSQMDRGDAPISARPGLF